MPVILSCSLGLYRADVFFATPTKPVAKKPIPGKPQAVKLAQKNVVQKKPAPDKTKGLRLLKGNAAGLPCSEETCTEVRRRQS
jgi:hypothetical protein